MAKLRLDRDRRRYWEEPRAPQQDDDDRADLISHLREASEREFYDRSTPGEDDGDYYYESVEHFEASPRRHHHDRRPAWDDDDGRLEPVADFGGYPEPDAYDRPGRRPRRSLAARLAVTVVTAAALMGGAAATYVAIVGGTLEAVLARSSGPETATPLDNAAAPKPPMVQAALQLAQQPSAPAQRQAARPPVPDAPALVILIRNAIVALHQANVTGNYAVLRQLSAPALQQANSLAGLSEAFADLRSRGIDLGQVTVVSPSLRRDPVVDEQGLLRLAGFFLAGSNQVDFDLAFQSVDGRWRLFGIGVYPPGSGDGAAAPILPEPETGRGAVPDGPTMAALVRSTVIALNQANLVGDYSVLRDIAAPGFQQANSAAQLSENFAELRARQLDLAPVAVIEPRLFRPPAIDQRGFLRLTGFFPSRPEQVNFDLAFQRVAGGWRLFGIGLNTSRQEPAAAAEPGEAAPAASDDGAQKIASPAATEPPTPRLRPAP